MKIIILIVLLLCVVWAFGSLERRTLYYPDKQIAATPAVEQLEFEEVNLRTRDGVQIHGWFVPAERKSKVPEPKSKVQSATQPALDSRVSSPMSKVLSKDRLWTLDSGHWTVLLFHGNAGNISHRLDKLLIFHKLGLNVLMVDYRGYGKSTGKPTEQGTYLDGEAAYQYLTEGRKIPATQIVLYGESLGCAVAIEIAHRHRAGVLILENPFTSTVAMGKLVFPWLPVQWMVRYRYDNLSKIPDIRLPLLVMHSPQDEIVPFAMGQQLYTAAPGPKKFFELSGGHNDGYEVTGNRYSEAIGSFLKGVR